MESNKYYTPEIEEIFNSPDLIYSKNVNINPYTYRDEIKYIDLKKDFDLNIVKVKYLDQKDIESLGFVLKTSPQYLSSLMFINKDLNMTITTNDFKVIDIFGKSNNNYDLHFQGNCKNKSELKKLLKQLNIDDSQ